MSFSLGEGGLELVHRFVEVLGLHLRGGDALLEGDDVVLGVVLAVAELRCDVGDVRDEAGLGGSGDFLCGRLELLSSIGNLLGQMFLNLGTELVEPFLL